MEVFKLEYIELNKYPFYYAGSDGNIYSRRGLAKQKDSYSNKLRKLKAFLDNKGKGYEFVMLPKIDEKGYSPKNVHKLVHEAFSGVVNKGMTVSHKNGDKFDNTPSNLKEESYSDNHKRKLLHGTHDRGCNNTRAILNNKQLKEIRKHLREGALLQREIGSIYGVSGNFISRIKNGIRYKEIKC